MIITITSIIFHSFMLVLAAYSLIAIYSLLRYARSKSLAATMAVVYVIIIAGIYSSAIIKLNNL